MICISLLSHLWQHFGGTVVPNEGSYFAISIRFDVVKPDGRAKSATLLPPLENNTAKARNRPVTSRPSSHNE